MVSSKSSATGPKENPHGFFIAGPGTLLKGNRYKIIRKLCQGPYSNTFLVEDLQFTIPHRKFLAAKILSIEATNNLKNGISHELEILQEVADRAFGTREPLLPILRDHFAQKGLQGVHYCFVFSPLRSDVDAFRASAPTGRLAVHIVKPIVSCAVGALEVLHSHNIIHGDIKADNILFPGPDRAEIEETIGEGPPSIEGSFKFDGTRYPILRSQPFLPKIAWNVTPHIAETIRVVLDDLGSALWADKPKPLRDIGEFALRAPENIIRAEYGKKIDIWSIGCMTYELLTGESVFQPQDIPGLTADESLLLLQFAVTGETPSKDFVNQSHVRDKFFNPDVMIEGSFIHSRGNVYPSQSIKERLTEQCNGTLTERQIDAAARFISDCLRLNPQDRLTVGQVAMHPWLSGAFMCCGMDDELDKPPAYGSTTPLPTSNTAPTRDMMAPSIFGQIHDKLTADQLSTHPWVSPEYTCTGDRNLPASCARTRPRMSSRFMAGGSSSPRTPRTPLNLKNPYPLGAIKTHGLPGSGFTSGVYL